MGQNFDQAKRDNMTGQKKIEQKSLQETITFSLFEVFFYFFCYCRLGITGKPTSLARRLGRTVGTGESGGDHRPKILADQFINFQPGNQKLCKSRLLSSTKGGENRIGL